ncbi:restriction endonuclease subunit S [Aliidiomarina quisquiliarum]|uniref:restriction endonuclease subunit S n=1 Tax=Aliidiomarina quisquiliarum TaxID=2938947 RepID=UPI00208F3A45|nr:restriction endonuclease subunit S [Aliidiomarina quisquiliarum]MCO4320683.1 restriction endonuclease subunit S [Aliidiomarina quisquiliarum]
MSADWPLKRLSEVADFLNHKRVPLKSLDRDKRQGGFPYYGASGIVDSIDDYIFDGNYLLISEDGENLRTRNTPIAFQANGKFWVNNHAHILQEKEEGILDYLEYYFSNLDLTPYITGAVQPKLNKRNLDSIEVPIPPMHSRLAINQVLNSFTNKIELNRQTNQTLEQIAQAIFKSWFVDFEPTRAKIIAQDMGANSATQELAAQAIICGAITLEQLADTEPQTLSTWLEQSIQQKLNQANPTGINPDQLKTTAALFPNALVELKEGGLAQQYNIIPEGWSVNPIYDIAEVIYGAPFKSKLFNTDGDGLPLVRIRDLKQERPGVSTPEVHPRGYLIQNGDLLVGMDGEFRPYIWGGHKAWMNQRVCTFKPKRNLSAALIREFISAQLRFFELTAVATTVIHLGKGDIDGFTYLEPNNELLNICSDVLEPIFQKIVSNKVECISLEELRDTLLPKLLSGELDVSALADNSEADA